MDVYYNIYNDKASSQVKYKHVLVPRNVVISPERHKNILVPKVSTNKNINYNDWIQSNEHYIDFVYDTFKSKLQASIVKHCKVVINEDELYNMLSWKMYKTSHNKYKKYPQ